MSVLNTIKAPVQKELDEFDVFFKNQIKSQASLLDIITNFVLKTKGKQIRPLMVFLSARLTGEINQSTYSAALLVELMHIATLIHDDVVDDSHLRRGMFSINALWKNKISVLVGDYFLAKGLLHSINQNEFELLRIVADAVREMSEGELIQIKKSRTLDIKEEIYFDIIEKKTASLLAAAVEVGGFSGGANLQQREKLKKLGINIGIAFQIKDDIFDYSNDSSIGKPTGNDIKERKITLPLIHVIETATPTEKKWILKILSKYNNNSAKVKELISYVHSNGGVEYATLKMKEYKQKALDELAYFKQSPVYEQYCLLIDYMIERKK
ncbi:MAG: polyprenyl synthetase family protein [Endomicrobiia bacterium]